ncbi:MAG: hypothetical protein ACRELB_04170, partial [Polyangiaceae bacterium]
MRSCSRLASRVRVVALSVLLLSASVASVASVAPSAWAGPASPASPPGPPGPPVPVRVLVPDDDN